MLKNLVLPGFKGNAISVIGKSLYNGFRESSLTLRASSIAYNFFLALFPMIIFIFTIIPYIPLHNLPNLLMDNLRTFFPEHVFKTVQSTIEDIIRRPRGGLLSFGFLMTMYFASNGINSIIVGFNHSAHTQETRSWFKRRLVCLILVLIMTVLIILSISLISLNARVLHFLMKNGFIKSNFSYYFILIGKWVIFIVLIYFWNSFIYFLGPAKSKQYKFFSPGSTLSTLLVLITTTGFNFYINNFSKYNALYGSIGTIIIVLIWIYLNAMVILIGYELNASIHGANQEVESVV